MNLTHITTYWANFFGIPPTAFHQMGCRVLPHRQLAGFQGAWLYRRDNNIILSVPKEEVFSLQKLVDKHPPTNKTLFSSTYIEYLFGSRVSKLIGPAFQGYYQANLGKSASIPDPVLRLDLEQHHETIETLSQSGDPIGWDHSGVFKKDSILYGYQYQGKLCALANYRMVADHIGFIGVYTHPEFRGRGFGRATVEAALVDLSRQGKTALYQTLHTNVASISIARRLGIQEFASHVAVRLKPKNSS
ncbi:MAG: GNAT family N-acetyltransferase [Saprospiraceae bacterium]|nr:GNAT family N-acetyltransferase [Saprospiraceae bacterium]